MRTKRVETVSEDQLATGNNETLRLEIKELKSLVIAGFEAISNNKPFETKV